jgi:hypothetical protein
MAEVLLCLGTKRPQLNVASYLCPVKSSEFVQLPPTQIKASVVKLKPFVFRGIQPEIRIEKFSCVKLNYALDWMKPA